MDGSTQKGCLITFAGENPPPPPFLQTISFNYRAVKAPNNLLSQGDGGLSCSGGWTGQGESFPASFQPHRLHTLCSSIVLCESTPRPGRTERRLCWIREGTTKGVCNTGGPNQTRIGTKVAGWYGQRPSRLSQQNKPPRRCVLGVTCFNTTRFSPAERRNESVHSFRATLRESYVTSCNMIPCSSLVWLPVLLLWAECLWNVAFPVET